MAIETLLTDLMVETITVAPVSAKDAYGKRTWGSATSITNCRVQSGTHKVVDRAGQEQVAVGRVYVPGAPSITLNDKITLPSGATPPILMVDQFSDERGSHHTVIHYGGG
jgi:hypothetical protein